MSSAQAVTLFAEATGILPVTVSNFARYMREHTQAHDSDLYVKSRPGGAHKDVSPQPRHLSNFKLALAAPTPAEGPETALALRLLPSPHHQQRDPATCPYAAIGRPDFALLPLGSLLSGLIEVIAADPLTAHTLNRWGWEMYVNAQRRFAWIEYIAPRMVGPATRDRYIEPELPGLYEGVRLRARIDRTARFPLSLIEVAAEIWAKTLAERSSPLLFAPPSPPTGADAKTPVPHHREPAPIRDHNECNHQAATAMTRSDSGNETEKTQVYSQRGSGHGLRKGVRRHVPPHPTDRPVG